MEMQTKVAELIDFALSRRNWVRGSVAALGGMALTGNVALGRAFAQDMGEVEVLNFALTLEHLEARMYADMLATNILTGKELTYFQNFGEHEAAHVEALTATIQSLGGTPVTALESYNFGPLTNRDEILNLARTAEEIGVGAYQGAATALINNDDLLAAAGSIVQVEARHAAIVRLLIGTDPVPDAFTASLTMDEVLEMVNPILGA